MLSLPVDVFWGLPSNSVPLRLTSLGKSKEVNQDLHKSGSSLRAFSKWLMVPCSSVQTIDGKCKQHSGRRRIVSYRDQHTLAWKLEINCRTTAKDLVKMLEETGIKVSIATVKVLHFFFFLETSSGLGKQKCLGHNDHHYVGSCLEAHDPGPEARGWQHHVVGELCCRREWYSTQNKWHHEKEKANAKINHSDISHSWNKVVIVTDLRLGMLTWIKYQELWISLNVFG